MLRHSMPLYGWPALALVVNVGAIIIALFLASCTVLPSPQTARQREAVAETGFQATLAAIDAADRAGKIPDGDKPALVAGIELAHSALVAWRAAVDNPGLEAAALAALADLKAKAPVDVPTLSRHGPPIDGAANAQCAYGRADPIRPLGSPGQGVVVFLGCHLGDQRGPGRRA